jgi:hypothetical protein
MNTAEIRNRLFNELPLLSWDIKELPNAVQVEELGLVFEDRARAIAAMFPALNVEVNKPFITIKTA